MVVTESDLDVIISTTGQLFGEVRWTVIRAAGTGGHTIFSIP